jgi:hypothetical protein
MTTTAFVIRDSHPIDNAHAGRHLKKDLTVSGQVFLFPQHSLLCRFIRCSLFRKPSDQGRHVFLG